MSERRTSKRSHDSHHRDTRRRPRDDSHDSHYRRHNERHQQHIRKRSRSPPPPHSPARQAGAHNAKSNESQGAPQDAPKEHLEVTEKERQSVGKRGSNANYCDQVSVEADGSISLSIEKTNELRARLGLKPLEVTPEEAAKPGAHSEPHDSEEEDQMEVRKRIEMVRWKRREREMLKRTRGLAESDDDDDGEGDGEETRDTVAWVQKQREIEREKKRAEQLYRQLEEDGEEEHKGVEAKVEHVDLAGMKVSHTPSAFTTEPVVLTLKDKCVLAEDGNEDELENITLFEKEKREWQRSNSDKRNVLYNAADNLETQDTHLLPQYDDKHMEMQRQGFVLGEQPAIDPQPLDVSVKKKNVSSLEVHKAVAKDYGDKQEVVIKKKKRKPSSNQLRQKATPKVAGTQQNPLLATPSASVVGQEDHGSRKENTNLARMEQEHVQEQLEREQNYQYAIDKAKEKSKSLFDPSIDEDPEMVERSMERTRRLEQVRNAKKGVEQMAELVQQNEQILQETRPKEGVTFDPMAEFCSSVAHSAKQQYEQHQQRQQSNGDGTTVTGNRNGGTPMIRIKNEEFVLKQEKLVEKKVKKSALRSRSSRIGDQNQEEEHVEQVQQSPIASMIKEEKEEQVALVEEPLVGGSLGAALAYVQQKGLVHKDYAGRIKDAIIEANTVTTNNSRANEVILEYRNKKGKLISTKQAFRELCYAFHGEAPSWNTKEKEARRAELEEKRKQMKDTDTPLGAVESLRKLQQVTGQAAIAMDKSLPSIVASTKPSKNASDEQKPAKKQKT